MNTEHINLISGLDRVLESARAFWLDSTSHYERSKWRVRLDELLDERLRLMALRDNG